jgi:hypothetical protein
MHLYNHNSDNFAKRIDFVDCCLWKVLDNITLALSNISLTIGDLSATKAAISGALPLEAHCTNGLRILRFNKSTLEPKTGAGSTRAAADGNEEEEDTESQPPDAATAAQLAKAREDAINEVQEAILTAIFLYNADKSGFHGLHERLNNDYLAGTDKYPKTLQAATNLLTYNQDNQSWVSKTKKSWEDDGECATSFAQTGKGKPKKGV